MKIAEIRQKAKDELLGEIKKIHAEHFGLRFRRVTDVIENPQALRELRRDLARIQTVLRERELAEKPAVAAVKPAAAPKVEAKKAEKAGKTRASRKK